MILFVCVDNAFFCLPFQSKVLPPHVLVLFCCRLSATENIGISIKALQLVLNLLVP